jgi:histidinol-phosphate aminotransferase
MLHQSAVNNAGSMVGTTALPHICPIRTKPQYRSDNLSFERKNIQAMAGYVSGEQPDSADVIKLNTNENPYPPGPAVAAALASLHVDNIRRYPPPTAMALRQSLAHLHKLHTDNIIVTNGGDELLRLLLATFLDTDECVGVAAPSYSLYDVLVAAHGCKMQNFALQDDWSLPPTLAMELNAASIKLCFVVNPHAPSGKLTAATELKKLANDFKGLLVIDEAYVDFVDPMLQHDCVPFVHELDNVIILRSFSKGYSLAGLRMAYGIGAKSLIDPMQYKTKDSYNTDFIAQTLARAAIEDQAYASDTWQKVREQREWLRIELDKLGLHAPASQSNFLLVDVPEGFAAADIYEALKTHGILVRYFKLPRLDNRLRITIGTPAENQKLLTALSSIVGITTTEREK